MDSITQIALGAAVGEATIGRKVGRIALLWGGICGLFPDLDLLIPLGDPVKVFTYHRGPSHSLFVLALLTPVFVRLILKIHPHTAEYRKRWYAMVYLALATHVLLDCFTVYGTQIFWPLTTPPVMWSTIFIVDPTYSVPLIAGVIMALILSRTANKGHFANTLCLVISTLYLAWSVGAKLYVENTARNSLERESIGYRQILTVPSPLNTFLWRVLVMDDKGYYEGYYSIFDPTDKVQLKHFPSDKKLLDQINEHWPVKRLKWFTQGYYAVNQHKKDIIITDLRMGSEPYYVFKFKVGSVGNPHHRPEKSERVQGDRPSLNYLARVWQRIWSPGV